MDRFCFIVMGKLIAIFGVRCDFCEVMFVNCQGWRDRNRHSVSEVTCDDWSTFGLYKRRENML